MTDLCHNCGDCHLGSHPTPCLQNINECIICGNYGHTFNFCPLGVRRIDKNFQYWMLCHNCDRWHLPVPCGESLVTCQKCHHVGHLPAFCPIIPDARSLPLGDSTANKGQRAHSNALGGGALVTDIKQIHPDLLRQIQDEAVSIMQSIEALSRGPEVNPQQNRSMSLGYHTTPMHSQASVQHFGTDPYRNIASQNPYGTPVGHYQQQQTDVPARLQKIPTPMPSSAMKLSKIIAADDPFVDKKPEEVRVEKEQPHGPTITESPEPAPVNLEAADGGKKPKKGRKGARAPGAPCAACKRTRKRCTHRAEDGTLINPTTPGNDTDQEPQPHIKKLKLTLESNQVSEGVEQNQATTSQEGYVDVDFNEFIDRILPTGNQLYQPGTDSNAGMATATPFPTVSYSMRRPGEAQRQTLPSLSEVMGGPFGAGYMAGNYLPYTTNSDSFMHGMGAMQQMPPPPVNGSYLTEEMRALIDEPYPLQQMSPPPDAGGQTTDNPAFTFTQPKSQLSRDVFSFNDNGKIDDVLERQQNVGGAPIMESPSGQIQYEPTSPMNVDDGVAASNEMGAAAVDEMEVKSNKAAPKKKGGARKPNK